MKNPKAIGDRVLFETTSDETTIHITLGVEKWKLGLLLAWLLAWLFCGVAVAIESANEETDVNRYILWGFLVFWAFFMFRVGRVFLWRLKGREEIIIKPGVMSIQNRMGKFGKVQYFQLQHLKKFGPEKQDAGNFMQFMDNSFWIMGGDKLGFSYMGKAYAFAKQLNPKDTKILLMLMDKHIRQMLKKVDEN